MSKRNSKQSPVFVTLAAVFIVAIMAAAVVYALYGLPRVTDVSEEQFYELRSRAKRVSEGMTLSEVKQLMGEPDYERGWLESMPNWRMYYFDANLDVNSGELPNCYVTVLIDTETGVQTVDVYDPVFESCNGNKIDSTCEPINRKHHDRFAGPVIIGS